MRDGLSMEKFDVEEFLRRMDAKAGGSCSGSVTLDKLYEVKEE